MAGERPKRSGCADRAFSVEALGLWRAGPGRRVWSTLEELSLLKLADQCLQFPSQDSQSVSQCITDGTDQPRNPLTAPPPLYINIHTPTGRVHLQTHTHGNSTEISQHATLSPRMLQQSVTDWNQPISKNQLLFDNNDGVILLHHTLCETPLIKSVRLHNIALSG